MPNSPTMYSSRKVYIDWKFQVVSICSSGKGGLAG